MLPNAARIALGRTVARRVLQPSRLASEAWLDASVQRCAAPAAPHRSFASAAPAEPEEPPYIPGVGKAKTSTGYVGLAVEPDWYPKLMKSFQALLDKMDASDMPDTAQYRIDVTKWCHFVMQTAAAHQTDPEAVEDAVQMGQVEELIEMAQDEMVALDCYLKVRMWELVEASNPTIDFDPNPMQDPFAEGGDPNVAEQVKKGNEAMKEEKK